MTREKQIEFHAGSTRDGLIANYVPTEQAIMYEDGFVDGATWADENPKEGLVSIDKVCKWIEENIWDFPWYDPDKPLSINDIIKELRKYLEE